MKKVLSLLLAVMMVVSLCPISALADEVNPIELQQVEAQEEQQEEPLPEQPGEQEGQKLNTIDFGESEAAPAETNAESGEGWDGTTVTEPAQVDGVYQIGTAEELAWFAAKVNDGTAAAANAVLTADIDLNNKEWTPIGNDDNPYEGTFDGADHRVSNLSITKGGVYAALFGYASGGAIKNITVSGKIAIDGYTDYSSDLGYIYAAGVVGWACANLDNCHNEVDVNLKNIKVTNSCIGGVAASFGTMDQGYTMVACTNKGNIYVEANPNNSSNGDIQAAGIAGFAFWMDADSKIEACANFGTVTAKLTGWGSDYAAGIANVSDYGNGKAAPINACYNVGKVETALIGNWGGCTFISASLVTYPDTNNQHLPQNCYYLKDTATTGMSTADGTTDDGTSGIAAKTSEELKSAEFLALLNAAESVTGKTIKWVAGDDGYPVVDNGKKPAAAPWDGTTVTEPAQESGVYQIGTAEELAWFAEKVNDGTAAAAKAVLTANIDLNSKEWTPIGSMTNKYSGTFDGQKHTVKNMSITVVARVMGLFGTVSGGNIKNLTVSGNIIASGHSDSSSSSYYIGGIAGNLQGNITNCTNEVNINITECQIKNTYYGGICGGFGVRKKTFTMTACTNRGNVYVEVNPNDSQYGNAIAGGITGSFSSASADSKMEACRNFGNVTLKLTGWGKAKAAGIVASLTYGNGLTTPINACYNVGKVETELVGNWGGCTLASASFAIFPATIKEQYNPTNCYYLEGTAATGVAQGGGTAVDDETSGVVKKTEAEMKSDELLAQLNSAASITDETFTWVKGADGYPEVGEVGTAVGIKSFVVEGVAATIDQNALTITAELPEEADITSVVPTIVCFGGAISEPASGVAQDFTNPVIYRVGNLAYTVTLTLKKPAISGSGTEADPYIIDSVEALKCMCEKYNVFPEKYGDKFWKQTAEIDMAGVKFNMIGKDTGNTNTTVYFTGTYDGGNYAIKNLKISSGSTSVGFFAAAKNAVIKNVVLGEGGEISGSKDNARIGGIVGYIPNNGDCKIENCVNYATVIGKSVRGFTTVDGYTGGIVGQVVGGRTVINGCKNYGNIKYNDGSLNYVVGGIIGTSGEKAVIVNCENHGEIYAPSKEQWSGLGNGSSAGGVAGYLYGTAVGCYNDGKVTGGMYVGGIAAQTLGDAIVESCYNIGRINADYEEANCAIGGIMGSGRGTINNCYNAGTITPCPGNNKTEMGKLFGEGGIEPTNASGNYFIGTELSEYGNNGRWVLTEENAKPVTEEWLKSDEAITKLNEHGTPKSLYKVTWIKSGEYPVFGKFEKIENYRNDILSFVVKVEGVDRRATIENNKITVQLPYGTTSIAPVITISDDATVSPASGEAVDITKGAVTYTVTAENGDIKIYTFEPEIPASGDGFVKFRADMSGTKVLAEEDFKQDVYEYSGEFFDRNFLTSATSRTYLAFWGTPAASGVKMSASFNGSAETDLAALAKGNAAGIVVWSDNEAQQLLKYGENIATIKVTSADGSKTTTYTIKFNMKPALTKLEVNSNGVVIPFDKEFNFAQTEYAISIPGNVKKLNIKAAVLMPEKVKLTMPEGTDENGNLDISKLDKFEIVAGEGANATTYTITINKAPTFKVNVTTVPANAAFALCDADGTIVNREADGSYILATGVQYSWSAAANGYAVQSGTIEQADAKDYNLVVTLTKASGKQPSAVSAEWPSFRGNANNMAIVSTKLPRTASEATEKWTKALGSGFAAAPSVQIIVDDSLVVMSGKNIYKLSMADGEILAQGKMVKSIDWGYTPATYANGMIFAPLHDGTVQAFNAKTLESLWVYSDPLKGQALSPITYSDGYIYTGFWNSETKDAAYVCIPVTDEDAENTTEAQKALWRDVVKGGFYWAGSVVVGDYVVYGTDDGSSGSTGTAKILSRNKLTGELLDSHEIVGDQRSSVAYANGKVYFTTKAGYLYSAELDKDGKLNNLTGKNYTEYGLMSTSTPVVYNGYVYFGIAKDNFSAPYSVMMVDASTLEVAASVSMQGYPQCSMLLSTAYEKSTGKIYLYSTYNNNPGGITAIEVDQAAKTMTATEIYTPSHPQYCITSLICDGEGTIYYKNDSGYLFAVKLADSVFVKDVEDLINAIGKVEFTDECKAKIDAARAAYDKLTDAQKKLVKNLKVLTDAEAEYQRLLDQHKADEAAAKAVDDLIAVIGKVEFTDASKAKIDAARAAYDKLTDAQKKLVKKLKILTDAEAEYQRLLDQHKADEVAAKAVDDMVNKLQPVTVNSGKAIEAARKAFDALTPEQKKLLDPKTEDKLVVAENEYKKLVKEDADKKAAEEVEDKIAALQPVTKDSGEAIKDARSSYEALTPEQKALVSKDSVAALDKAEKVYDMIIASTKPGTAVGDNTGSTSGSGVIKITANAAAKGEQNPNTGAPAMSMAPAVLVLAAAALVLKKHK